MKDLFGNEVIEKPVNINIFADEVYGKICPYTKNIWHYLGIIVEDLDHPLLDDIIHERFMGNYDVHSPYYEKNNKIVHWSDIRIADTKNICKRWFNYILNPGRSSSKFYSYILGLNDSYLEKEEFDIKDEFNSKYNRFFRSAVLYALKVFFRGKHVVVENTYHEVGQQAHSKYFPWHVIYKLEQEEQNISFNCREITFLPKDHRKDQRSNIIQLCDVVLGVSTSIIHGIEKSRSSLYREELANLYSAIFKRIIENPKNKNSWYKYYNRIMISFFPNKKTAPDDIRRLSNQFYTKRKLYYIEKKSGQMELF